jgi:hypothetical protein
MTFPSEPPAAARDPRLDPQPGDSLRIGGQSRTVIRRFGDSIQCESGSMRYRISLRSWRAWCAKATNTEEQR